MIDVFYDYEQNLPVYLEVESIAAQLIEDALAESNIHIHQLVHRIKEMDSAMEKLERRSTKYSSIEEFTDMVGFRIICYFADQVNVVADIIEKVLDVDKNKSTDKRKVIAPNVFGYLSLHYICSLPKDKGYPDELCNIQFEIQMRSILQHAWAEIEHDLGYKTEFAIPRNVRREFSRVAGLLEIADECFDNIRRSVIEYEEKAHNDMVNDTADEMTLDLVTLKAFIMYSKKMREFNEKIASFSGADIIEANPESYIVQLEFLGIKKIGDLYKMIYEYGDYALSTAKRILTNSEIDQLVNTVGLYYLCRAKLTCGDYTTEEVIDYFKQSGCSDEKAIKRAEHILKQKNK